jgi:hypothetical protein
MKPARKNPKMGPLAIGGTDGARRAAAVILEVLSGVRGTAQACEALSITPMRYYVLETRALQGLVGALEPRARGKRRSPEDEIRQIRREKVKLERELARTQALVRAAERTIGIPAVVSKSKIAEGGKKPRRARRSERAGRAIAALRAPATAGGEGPARAAPGSSGA